jgi:GNAT superfamily N-acetyltransferase
MAGAAQRPLTAATAARGEAAQRARRCLQMLHDRSLIGWVPGTRISGPALFGLRVRAPYVVLSDLWVSPSCRREGHGRRILEMVVAAADACGCPLRLRASPFDVRRGGMSAGELRGWYARFGFGDTRGGQMVRHARRDDHA